MQKASAKARKSQVDSCGWATSADSSNVCAETPSTAIATSMSSDPTSV